MVTGKGGTGKTLVSAALARLGAKLGRRVFCAEISSDPDASSRVAEAFGVKLSGEAPREVAPGLRVGMVTPTMGHRRFLEDVLPVRLLADAAMRSG
ncbi:MAG: arsenic transporter, partial [Deltaproteobacteria bacterium]|nr:arsenic transporter [Deltaproteobacteria bacterium]